MTLINALASQVRRDVILASREGGGALQSVFFYAVFVGLAGFAAGPEASTLLIAGPGMVWLAIIIAMQLAATGLFRPDLEDGTLSIMRAEQGALWPYVAGRVIALLLTVAVPMIVLTPIAWMMFAAEPGDSVRGTIMVVTAMPAIILSSIVAAGLSAGLGAGGVIGTILAAPLAIPIVIFGLRAQESWALSGQFFSPDCMLLLAVSLVYLVVMPPFAVLSIRTALE